MTGALFYLQYHSVKNRTLMRIRRLKQPKYLAGLIVGGLYLYFYLFRLVLHQRGGSLPFSLSPDNRLLLEFGGAAILGVIVFLAWVIPHERAALTFTEAEIAFLFPAPISRRTLIHFKLLRSQTAILFTTFILTIVFRRFGGHAWIHAVGWWLILSNLNLHLLGSSFALTRLMDRGITKWPRRLAILAVITVAAVVVVIWARRALPPFNLSQYGDLDGIKAYLQQALTSGPVPYLLYPFRLVVRPYFAPDAVAFLRVLVPVLLLLVLQYIWVVRSNVAFEEASVAASKKLAERVAAVRAGNWQGARKSSKRRAPFRLRPTGPPSIALLWKNLIGAGQVFTARIWISFAAFGVFASIGLGRVAGGNGLLPFVGMAALMLLVWSLLIGPQLLRQDFRQDLAMADVLKSYPLRGWQIVVGELMAPAVILTGIQWFLIIIAYGFFSAPDFGRALKLGLALGAAMVSPVLNLILLQIPNAAVLLFPGWFLAVKGVSQGIEVTGQRLIFMIVQLLVFTLALVPAAACFAAIFFLVKTLATALLGVSLAIAAGVVTASGAAALILGAEAALGVMLLGWLFQRYDVAVEQTT